MQVKPIIEDILMIPIVLAVFPICVIGLATIHSSNIIITVLYFLWLITAIILLLYNKED